MDEHATADELDLQRDMEAARARVLATLDGTDDLNARERAILGQIRSDLDRRDDGD